MQEPQRAIQANPDALDRQRIAHLFDNLAVFEGRIPQKEFDFLNGQLARYKRFGSHLAVTQNQLAWMTAIYRKIEGIPLPTKEAKPDITPREILAPHVGGLLRHADYAIEALELHGFTINRKETK